VLGVVCLGVVCLVGWCALYDIIVIRVYCLVVDVGDVLVGYCFVVYKIGWFGWFMVVLFGFGLDSVVFNSS